MKTTQDRARLPGIRCPHCRGKTMIRDSQQVTLSVRELRIVCTDDDCGFSAVAQLAYTREIRPSAKPNPEIRLPFGAWSRPANENHPAPANDDAARAERLGLIGDALAGAMTT